MGHYNIFILRNFQKKKILFLTNPNPNSYIHKHLVFVHISGSGYSETINVGPNNCNSDSTDLDPNIPKS